MKWLRCRIPCRQRLRGWIRHICRSEDLVKGVGKRKGVFGLEELRKPFLKPSRSDPTLLSSYGDAACLSATCCHGVRTRSH